MGNPTLQRTHGRALDELREFTFQRRYLEFAEGSCLVQFGRTKVICAASIEDKAPPFLVGSGQGWVTAEYAMLPKSTQKRSPRSKIKSGRNQEIQRLIGRSLRSVMDLVKIGERTIYIDCDVIQADGGTRTASISGAGGRSARRVVVYDEKSFNQRMAYAGTRRRNERRDCGRG